MKPIIFGPAHTVGRYTPEFRYEATLRWAFGPGSIRETGKELGLSYDTLYMWIRSQFGTVDKAEAQAYFRRLEAIRKRHNLT